MKLIKKITGPIYNAFVKFLENVMSKKFLVFITSTALLCYMMIPPEVWLPVALGVLGVEGVLDFRGGRRSFHDETPSGVDGLPSSREEIP